MSTRSASAPDACNVLVVEDDRTIARNLVEFLELHGHRADIAYDGAAAIARASSEHYDVIVLDLGLPRIDGLKVLDQLRRLLRMSTPVLVATARDEITAKLNTFSLGADDYITKPFALSEVEARVKALHRRAKGVVIGEEMRCGKLKFDRRTREVSVGSQSVTLAPRAMQILEILMRDPGRVITRRELETELWPDDPPERDSLRSQIHLLRRALSMAGFDDLDTVHGVGWRLRDSSKGPA